ncbi:MAG: SRPBCC family protein [Bacteroidota bacterium]
MELKKSVLIRQPIGKVWDILGNQFTQADQWASGLYHSEGKGKPEISGAVCDQRSCQTSFGNVTEKLRTLDAENKILSYEVIEGFPFFVERGVNTWKLFPDAQGTRVEVCLELTTKGLFGTVMAPMLKWQMGGILEAAVDDLKQYVETGEPSHRKAKELAKAQAA